MHSCVTLVTQTARATSRKMTGTVPLVVASAIVPWHHRQVEVLQARVPTRQRTARLFRICLLSNVLVRTCSVSVMVTLILLIRLIICSFLTIRAGLITLLVKKVSV